MRASDPARIRQVPYDLGDRPFIVIWEVTRACDLVCAHCRAEAVPHRHPLELSTAEAHRLFDEIASFGPPSPLLVLTGGDPGAFDRTLEVAAWVRETGAKLQINTTVTSTSITQLADVLARVVALGATLWSVFILVPTGRGTALDQPTAQQIEDVLHFLVEAGRHISVKATEAPHFQWVPAAPRRFGAGAIPRRHLPRGPAHARSA